ncbi:hypothetical protein D3C71_1968430 [compost metagenome]
MDGKTIWIGADYRAYPPTGIQLPDPPGTDLYPTGSSKEKGGSGPNPKDRGRAGRRKNQRGHLSQIKLF